LRAPEKKKKKGIQSSPYRAHVCFAGHFGGAADPVRFCRAVKKGKRKRKREGEKGRANGQRPNQLRFLLLTLNVRAPELLSLNRKKKRGGNEIARLRGSIALVPFPP